VNQKTVIEDTLGIPGVTVAQAIKIIGSLTFSGPPPKIPRGTLLLMHWGAEMTFREIADFAGLHITAIQNEHAHILRRLRWEFSNSSARPT